MIIHNCVFAVLGFLAPCLALVSCHGEGPSDDSGSAGSVGSGGRADGTAGSGGIQAVAGTTQAGASFTGGTSFSGGNGGTAGTIGSGGTQAGAAGSGGTTASGGGAAGRGGTASIGGNGGNGGAGEPEFHIYLALGQSNMQGAAHLPDQPISHPRVMVLQGQNCSEHTVRYGEWRNHFQPMIRCREGDRPKPDGSSAPIGLSPADSFAVAMAEAAGPNVTIGIVGAAYGGSTIEAHLPDCGSFCKPPYGDVNGAPVVNGTTPLYAWIKDLATKAQKRGTIKGIIFHQGESNSGQQAWLTGVQTYITSLRNDLGLNAADVPFIAGELPRTGCCASHNSLVQQIPDYVENGHWVSSGPMPDGTVLGDRGDSLHWSTFSAIEMGKRYAQKMLEVSQ